METTLTKETLLAERKDFKKRFWRMLIVIALQNVIVYGVNLLDNIMIGGYTELALQGVALVITPSAISRTNIPLFPETCPSRQPNKPS